MSVRDLAARLAGSVEDSISERLGYRETDVYLPSLIGLGPKVTPRPIVEEQDIDSALRSSAGAILTEYSDRRPVTLFKVQIPRTYSSTVILAEGVWGLQTDGQALISCYPAAITRTDTRWKVYLIPNRNESFTP